MNSIPLVVIIQILLIHFLADFVLQTHEQAINKSTDTKWLLYHVLSYCFCWVFGSYVLFGNLVDSVVFVIITGVFHFITDYFTSRIGKPFWDKNDLHNGFVVVGADQVLHYIQLVLTYLIINEYSNLS